MHDENLDQFKTQIEMQIYREYHDVVPMFTYVVETERRFYLANKVSLEHRGDPQAPYFELALEDAWVWDMYRPARFLSQVKVLTFKDVNIEELEHADKL